jgi:putative inorganic carbon (HCO3(-)) transporter
MLYEALTGGMIVASAAYALWRLPPAYPLSLAMFACVFSGNWSAMGLPSGLPPDHALETVGILMVVLRAPAVADRRIVLRPVHWMMGTAVIYVLVDSIATSGHFLAAFPLVDGFGVYPFLMFLVAPIAFHTRRERQVLLIVLLALGAYLGFTALMEGLRINGLVFPKYILNPLVGDPSGEGRARGPFAAAVQNGFGLYGCAVAATVAVAMASRLRLRIVAGSIGMLCLLGTLFTEQRSVWVATIIATAVVLAANRRLRTWAVPALVVGAVAVATAFAVVPGLATDVHTRLSDSEPVWERLNLDVAAENMIEAKPILGFGWGSFAAASGPYFRQSASYPLVYTTVIHNVYLSIAAEVGIAGLALWLAILAFGIGGAIKGPPLAEGADQSWRTALLAYGVFYLIVITFVPIPTSFPPLFLWLMAGIGSGLRSPQYVRSGRATLREDLAIAAVGPTRQGQVSH